MSYYRHQYNNNQEKSTNQCLVDPMKKHFIFCRSVKDGIKVFVPFKFINGRSEPVLVTPKNRRRRADNIISVAPIQITYDGEQIYIDGITKTVNFKEDAEGIIQYTYTNNTTKIDSILYKTNLCKEVICLNENEKKENLVPFTLKIYPVMFEYGCLVSIIDPVEKVLHFPILNNKSGLIGISELNSSKDNNPSFINQIKRMWEELEFNFKVTNNKLEIYSNFVKKYPDIFKENSFLRIHRNFGSDDIVVENEYELYHSEETIEEQNIE